MEEVAFEIAVVIAAIVGIVSAVGFVLAAVCWFLVEVGYWVIALLDWLFSSSAVPGAPALAWAIWGMLAGASIGFWTIAPVYGWRSRGVLLWIVPLAAVAVACLCSLSGASI